MSEFLTAGQIVTLPVAVGLVWFVANWAHAQVGWPAQRVAAGVALVYAVAVFVWPLPAPAATGQEWAVRVVVALCNAVVVVAAASDLSGRLEARGVRGRGSRTFSVRWWQ